MKKSIFSLITMLFICISVNAQETKTADLNNLLIILDGKLISSGADTLKNFKREAIESVTVVKEKKHKAIFGINDERGLLIIITKDKKGTKENIDLLEKISKIDFKNKVAPPNLDTEAKVDSSGNQAYDFVSIEKQPMFPGGLQEFYRYLGQNIRYPKIAIKNKTYGNVFLSFVVERDGKLTDVQVVKGVSPEIDKEAIRVISNSPKWNPGIQDGRTVRVKYNINVNFNLN